jgi:hypothetical protein
MIRPDPTASVGTENPALESGASRRHCTAAGGSATMRAQEAPA